VGDLRRAAAAAAAGAGLVPARLAGAPAELRLLAPASPGPGVGGKEGGSGEVGAAWGSAEEDEQAGGALGPSGRGGRALSAADAAPLAGAGFPVASGATLVAVPRRPRPDAALPPEGWGAAFGEGGARGRGSLVRHPALAAQQPAGPSRQELDDACAALARAEGLPADRRAPLFLGPPRGSGLPDWRDLLAGGGRGAEQFVARALAGAREGGAGGRFGGVTPFDPIEVPPSLLRWLDAGGGGAPPAARSEPGDEDEAWESDEGPSDGESDGGQEVPPPPPPEPATEAVAQLEDMGFPPALARKALQLRAGSVPGAAEWLLAHADDPGAGAPLTEEELRRIAGPSRGAVRRQARERREASRRREADAGAVRQLTEMGFEEARAHRALRATGNSVELACQLLLQGAEPPLVARAEPRREPGPGGAPRPPPDGGAGAPAPTVAEVERRLRRMLSRTIRDSMAGAAPPPEGFTVQDIEGALRDLDDGTGTIALRELDEVLQRVLRDLGAPAPQGGGEREGARSGGGGGDAPPQNPGELLRLLRAAGAGDDVAARGGPDAGVAGSAEGPPSADVPAGEGGAGEAEEGADAP